MSPLRCVEAWWKLRHDVTFRSTVDCKLHSLYLRSGEAFDIISHEYIFQVLVVVEAGIPSDFQRLARVLYSGPTSAVQGLLSEPFTVSRGVRQGCPQSLALYVLANDPLLQMLARYPQISRFTTCPHVCLCRRPDYRRPRRGICVLRLGCHRRVPQCK